MQSIRNLTSAPLRISLPGGKTLHLGPGKIAQVEDRATESAGLKRLVEAGSIEILGEVEHQEGFAGTGPGAEQTQGRSKSPFRRRSGER